MSQQHLAIVALYACLNTFVLLWLGASISRLRRKHRVLIGDGGIEHLRRTMRGHANAAENMPMMFVLLTLGALLGAPAVALHVLGAGFTLGRVIHAWHFIQEHGAPWQRMIGFGLSLLAMVAAALGLLGHALAGLLA